MITYELFIEEAKIINGEVVVALFEQECLKYGFFWLRDNCRCNKCYNTQTFQRMNDLLDIPDNPKPEKIIVKKEELLIEWDDKHCSTYSVDFLWKCWPKNWRKNKTHRVLWSGDDVKDKIAYIKKDDFMNSDIAFKRFLHSIVTYGIAFVDEVGNNMEDTEMVIKRVGPAMQTLFGGVWSFTSDMARADTAYTTIPLGPHNDNTYFEDAAGLQILHCLEHTGTGGNTFLLDGFYGAEQLRKSDSRAFEVLTKTLQPAEYLENGWHHSYTAPVIVVDPVNGQIQQIRFNTYDRSSYCIGTGEETTEYYAALKALARQYTSTESQWHFKLHPGRVVFFDNWRVLHGRTGFTGKRVLGGAYISRRDWLSAARVHKLLP